MNVSDIRSNGTQRTIMVAAGVVILVLSAALVLGFGEGEGRLGARQAEVAARGAEVMPFDLEQTRHVFEELDDGGLQIVVAKDPANAEQIRLIRDHLQEEAERFRRGDFGDPATIHGQEMPGLRELRASAGRIEVGYSALPGGAQLRYHTTDPQLVDALHRWFAAQVSDHGAHASGS